MGYLFHEPLQFVRTFGQGVLTPFRMPGVIVDEHKYQTDRGYRELIDKKEEELEKKEQKRIAKLQAKLDEFIAKDVQCEERESNATQTKK